jgi:hypothetical protein
MLPLSNVFDPKEFEIILGNNLPKGTLKLHNTINSIDCFDLQIKGVWSEPSVAEDNSLLSQTFLTHEAYSIVNIIRDLATKAEPSTRILYICRSINNCSFVKHQRFDF